MMIHFVNLQVLWWLLILPVLAGVLHLLFLRKQQKASSFKAEHLWDKTEWALFKRREQCQALGLMIAIAMIIVAMARPQWGEREDTLKREGLDIMIAVDVSKSMLTRDVSPTRLGRTQWAIKDLVKTLKGDRIGLMAFAGEAFIMCPLTLDYQGFLMSADDLSPEIIPKPGTNLSKAIDEMLRLEGKVANHYQVLVLITDGEELDGSALSAARRAKEKGIKIFTVGVGTKQGDLIEIPDGRGGKDFLKDSAGQVIKSSLNENLLQQIAYETGGAYVRSSPVEFGLDFLYEKQLALIPKREMESKSSTQFIDRYQIFIALSLVGFGLMLMPEHVLRRLILSILFLGLFASNAQASINESVNQANQAYRQGDFDKAQQIYQEAHQKRESDDRIAFNLANSFYKKGDYDKASDLYERLKVSKDENVALSASFNLGNARYRQSEAQEKVGDINNAIEAVSASIKDYDDVLSKKPEDKDALVNSKKAKQKLEELKRKKEEQKQQQDNQDNKSNKNDQDQQYNNQQQGEQHQQNKQQQYQQKLQNQQNQQNQQDKQSVENPSSKKDQAKKEQLQDQSNEQAKKDQAQVSKDKELKAQQTEETIEQKQANAMLEDYRRQEEPKGMLYLIDKHSSDQPVTKDW